MLCSLQHDKIKKMTLSEEHKRIHELDFARGVAVLCMLCIHFFAFADFFGGWDVSWPPAVRFVKQYFGAFFILLSGLCSCLGTHHLRSGLTVLCCAFLLTGATEALYLSGTCSGMVQIQWGVLHTIGTCMLLSGLMRRLPLWLRTVLAAVILVTGYWLYFEVRVLNPWIFMFGLRVRTFQAFDYFPLLPHMGWFLLGTVLGDSLYREKKPLFPDFRCAFAEFFGRHSLLIYMGHMILFFVMFRFVFYRGV